MGTKSNRETGSTLIYRNDPRMGSTRWLKASGPLTRESLATGQDAIREREPTHGNMGKTPDECANLLCIPRPNRQTPDGATIGAILDCLSRASAGHRVRFTHGDRARTLASAETLRRWAEALGVDGSLITVDVPGEVDTVTCHVGYGLAEPRMESGPSTVAAVGTIKAASAYAPPSSWSQAQAADGYALNYTKSDDGRRVLTSIKSGGAIAWSGSVEVGPRDVIGVEPRGNGRVYPTVNGQAVGQTVAAVPGGVAGASDCDERARIRIRSAAVNSIAEGKPCLHVDDLGRHISIWKNDYALGYTVRVLTSEASGDSWHIRRHDDALDRYVALAMGGPVEDETVPVRGTLRIENAKRDDGRHGLAPSDAEPLDAARVLTGHRSDTPSGVPIPTPVEHIDLLAAMAQRPRPATDDTERARRFFAGEGEGRTSGANQWQGAANCGERGTR